MSELTLIGQNQSFGGWLKNYTHQSEVCQSKMTFAVYLPPQVQSPQSQPPQAQQDPSQAQQDQKLPVVFWLSGGTCTHENFMQKAGAQRVAAELGIILVAPDTSPRGCGIKGEDDSYDFGTGAGFYCDAQIEPWKANYQMASYTARELPRVIADNFAVDMDRCSVSGHSMGGHGALTLAFKNPGLFKSASAFSPICAPTECGWGRKALAGYLGDESELWRQYDACALISSNPDIKLPLLIDQGSEDEFLPQLMTGNLEKVLQDYQGEHQLRYQQGYDHSYYFIASFIEEHLRWHTRFW